MNNLKIFPYEIAPDGRKKPISQGWETEASSDPSVHRKWMEFYGNRIAGWLIPTGKINGLWALDIDVKDGINGFDSLKQLGVDTLPMT